MVTHLEQAARELGFAYLGHGIIGVGIGDNVLHMYALNEEVVKLCPTTFKGFNVIVKITGPIVAL